MSVVRSTVASWITTTWSSAERRTSNSNTATPATRAWAKPASVFSGASLRAPRWPNRITLSPKPGRAATRPSASPAPTPDMRPASPEVFRPQVCGVVSPVTGQPTRVPAMVPLAAGAGSDRPSTTPRSAQARRATEHLAHDDRPAQAGEQQRGAGRAPGAWRTAGRSPPPPAPRPPPPPARTRRGCDAPGPGPAGTKSPPCGGTPSSEQTPSGSAPSPASWRRRSAPAPPPRPPGCRLASCCPTLRVLLAR